MDSVKHYDILVIGAGGGAKLVTPPSNIGYKVAVLEKEKPGDLFKPGLYSFEDAGISC